MNPLIQHPKITTLLLVTFVLVGLTISPSAQAQQGCNPIFTTAAGCDALSSLDTGTANTAFGWRALFSNSTGNFNTGVGGGALSLNNADSNTAVGAAALLLNTTGTQNTAIGTDAMVYNDTGSENTATGFNALTANTSGNNNTAVGNLALQSSQTTSDHVCVGREAGSGITTANNNIIIGHHSGVHSVFGEESDRCFIDNIHGAPVSAATAAVVMVDSDGRLGTVTADGPGQGRSSSKGIKPQAIPDPAKQAMLNFKVQRLQATIAELKSTIARQQNGFASELARQHKQIEALAAGLQKASAQLELKKPAPQTVLNNR
jgi:hypothetical protein